MLGGIFEEIQRLCLLDKRRSATDGILAVVEEAGEVAKCCSVEEGFKSSSLKEGVVEESADVVLCAISLFFLAGGESEEELEGLIREKLPKWKKHIRGQDGGQDG